VVACASSSLDDASGARARLGPSVWSQVVRVENTAPHSPYPRELYALVFEAAGRLWFYTGSEGTQSFSLRRNQLAAEKADFAPLLRAIDPGFTTFQIVDTATNGQRAGRTEGPLPNGCLVESLAALRDRLARGELIEQARLLLFYFEADGAPHGHTVLEYETPRGAFAVDAAASANRTRPLDRRIAGDPVAVARALRPDLAITAARWVPTELPRTGRYLAALTPTGANRVGQSEGSVMR